MTREHGALSALIVLLIVLWAGFVVHRSPRFPGSLSGGVLAISGATLMVLFSLAYMAVKRIPRLRSSISARLPMGKLLPWHVYTGALGAILALLHTGHRFESDLGIALTATMLLTVLSGYVGRHLLGHVSLEVREKQGQLAKLETAYNEVAGELARAPAVLDLPDHAVRLAESIAELEHSIRMHERFKRLATRWLKIHIAASLAFNSLLGLHIWAAIHFGLRWFE